MSNELMTEIKKLNQNLEWFKSYQLNPLDQGEYLSMKEAMHLLKRQRTWLQNRMVKELEPDTNVNDSLVRNVDWIREGNRIMIKKESLLRLKNQVLTAIGDKYDNL
jgi:tRNA A37 N6-isopentenylltransferase MiaA